MLAAWADRAVVVVAATEGREVVAGLAGLEVVAATVGLNAAR
jgi:hypothetical protein